MKIIVVSLDDSNKIKTGGKHVHQELLVKGLRKMGHEVHKVFPNKPLHYWASKIVYRLATVLRFKGKSSEFKWSLNYLYKDLKSQLGKLEKIDLVFSQDPLSAVAASDSGLEGRLILTLHGYMARESVNYGGFLPGEEVLVHEAALAFEKRALNGVKHIITVDTRISHYLREELGYKGPSSVLKNAIDPDIFGKLNSEDETALREKYCSKESSLLVLIPRRLVKKNGVDVALKAADLLRDGKTSFKFLIAGDGPERASLEQLMTSLQLTKSQVEFVGNINHPEVASYYDACDIVLIPSIPIHGIEEATSLSMLEGMAAKKIVVTSAIGGMKEVITDGVNGFLFEAGSQTELAKTLLCIGQLDQSQVGTIVSNAYQQVCAEHHFQRHSEEYLAAGAIGKDTNSS